MSTDNELQKHTRIQ